MANSLNGLPEDDKDAKPTDTFAMFLESRPPNFHGVVSTIMEEGAGSAGKRYLGVTLPEIKLHCDDESCRGERFFRPKKYEGPTLYDDTWKRIAPITCAE